MDGSHYRFWRRLIVHEVLHNFVEDPLEIVGCGAVLRLRLEVSAPTKAYTPKLVELPEVVRAFFLLPDNGDRAVGVPHHGLRYAAHKRPPYPAAAPAAHHYQPGTHAVGQVDDLFVRPSQP
jgi:hypothetical protein